MSFWAKNDAGYDISEYYSGNECDSSSDEDILAKCDQPSNDVLVNQLVKTDDFHASPAVKDVLDENKRKRQLQKCYPSIVLNENPKAAPRRLSTSNSNRSESELSDFEEELNQNVNKHISNIFGFHTKAHKSPKMSEASTSKVDGANEGDVDSNESCSDNNDSDADSDHGSVGKEGAEFYDPDEDDKNEEWWNNVRSKYCPNTVPKSSVPSNSDAVLNCPACMTTVCMDCQQHELYQDQFRAMFVFNCVVDYSQPLHYTPKLANNHVRRKRHNDSSGTTTTTSNDKDEPEHEFNNKKFTKINPTDVSNYAKEDLYYSVTCQNCHTLLAYYDHEEIYHFCNILSSPT